MSEADKAVEDYTGTTIDVPTVSEQSDGIIDNKTANHQCRLTKFLMNQSCNMVDKRSNLTGVLERAAIKNDSHSGCTGRF